MKVGEIAGPIKTQFGYHIIRLDEIQPGKSKSFEEARSELEAQVRRDHATDRFGDIQEQLSAKLAEPGADLAALAEQFHLQQGDVASYAKGAGAAPLGAAPALQELLFGDPPLAVGHLGGPVLLGDDRLVIVKVLDHRKPAPQPLAEVRAGIVTTLTGEQETAAALKAAESAREKLASGTSFDAIAKELKVSADPAHFIGRSDPSVPAQVREAAFAAPHPAGKPESCTVALGDGGAALVAVTAVRTVAARAATVHSERALQEAQQLGTADAKAYELNVRRTADVRKNPKAFD
jgi:peptidyl-prolyl cis-trans isomerase D